MEKSAFMVAIKKMSKYKCDGCRKKPDDAMLLPVPADDKGYILLCRDCIGKRAVIAMKASKVRAKAIEQKNSAVR